MALGTPYLIGSASEHTAGTATIVINVGATDSGSTGSASGTTAGDAIVVQASCASLINVTSATDTQGNTYVLQPGAGEATSFGAGTLVALNAAKLTAGTDSITVTFATTTGSEINAAAVGCSGVATVSAVDVATAAHASTGATVSVSSGALASASEVLVAFETNADLSGNITWASPFSGLVLAGNIQTASNPISAAAALVVSSAASVTASGTITSGKWDILLVSLKASGAGPSAAAVLTGGAGVLAAGAVTSTAGGAALTGGAGVLTAGTAAPVTAAIGVTVAGQASFAFPLTQASGVPAPATQSLPVPVTTNPGDWLFAIISWHQPPGSPGVTFSVADDAQSATGTRGHNWWDPVGTPNGTSSSLGVTQTAIWCAPAARGCTNVYIAPTGFALSVACTVLDVSGMQPWFTLTGIETAYVNAATALPALALPVPSAQALVISACSADLVADSLTLTGAGWTSTPTISVSNGADTTSDLKQRAAYQVTSGATSATWSSSGTQDLSGVIGAVLTSAQMPGQPSRYWPVTIAEMAPGSGIGSAPDTLSWTATTARYLKMGATQGRQYELAQLSTGEGTLLLDNPDGALLPPGTGSFAGVTSGTPYRLRCAWPGGSWQVSFTGNGSSSGPKISTGNIYPGVAGTTYSASAWLSCSPLYASGMHLTMNFRTSGGALISSVLSGSVTGLEAQLATVSGVAPATTALIELTIGAAGTPAASVTFYAAAVFASGDPGYLFIPPGVSWAGENGATPVTLAPFSPDPAGPPNATPWYIPFSGFIERLPQSWDELLRGRVEATIVDAWAGVNYVPQPILIDEMLNDLPYAFWPLTDPAGATAATNQAPGNLNPLVVSRSKYGAGTATEAFGQNSSAILGAQGTLLLTSSGSFRASSQSGMWGQTAPGGVSNSPSQGYSLTCTDAGFPSITTGVTIEFWSQVTGLGNGISGVLAYIFEPGAITSDVNFLLQVAVFSVAGTDYFQLGWLSANGPVDAGGFESAIVGTWVPGDLYQVAVTFTQAAYAFYINGSLSASGTFTGGGLRAPSFATIGLGGPSFSGNSTIGPLTPVGTTGFCAVYPEILSQQRISTHYLAGATALAGEFSSERIERLLQAGNATGRRVILQETGLERDAVVSCQDISGSPASQGVSNITTDLVPAMFYIAPTGDMFHLAKQFAWNQPVQWVLGQDTSLGQIPFKGDLVFDWDPTRLINQIQLTQLDTQNVTVPSVTSEEEASQDAYGTISYQETGYLQNDSTSPYGAGPGLTDLADYLATTYAAPSLRLSQITVEASANPTLWPFVLGVSPGDMVTVNRVAQEGVQISVTGRVTQTDRSFESGLSPVASVSILVDPAPEESPLILGDAVHGLLNGSNILSW